jgi:hypothetical protein
MQTPTPALPDDNRARGGSRGAAFAVSVSTLPRGLVMTREHGRLVRGQHHVIAIEFTTHRADLWREPSCFELHDLIEPLKPGEMLLLESESGRIYNIRMLDAIHMAANIPLTRGRTGR